MKRDGQLRIFLSYAHEDSPLAKKVRSVLMEMGFDATLDEDFKAGAPFADAIKANILHSHLLMPILTENTPTRPWVHQEIGYAVALNIPVLPIAVETVPGELTAHLQAITINRNIKEEDLKERLQRENIMQVVCPPPAPPASIVEIALWPEARTELLARYANRVLELGRSGTLRQIGGLSSFCLPDKNIDDDIWSKRDGEIVRSDYYHFLQREERRALERHAKDSGCRLVIYPKLSLSHAIGVASVCCRLDTLIDFLATNKRDNVEVAIAERTPGSSLTILGEWFQAESLVPRAGKGYWQTVFSWHAPTVSQSVRRFDDEFEKLQVFTADGIEKCILELKQVKESLLNDPARKVIRATSGPP